MRNGLSAGPIPVVLPFAAEIERACEAVPNGFSPMVAYAIKLNETGLNDPPTIQSADGGHGLMQLTSSWPTNWQQPYANALWAVEFYLVPAETYWAGQGMQGDDLVRCIAAEFNAGRGGAMDGHRIGNVDAYTTNGYAARALKHYHLLVAGDVESIRNGGAS